jgi:hypothetical protein
MQSSHRKHAECRVARRSWETKLEASNFRVLTEQAIAHIKPFWRSGTILKLYFTECWCGMLRIHIMESIGVRTDEEWKGTILVVRHVASIQQPRSSTAHFGSPTRPGRTSAGLNFNAQGLPVFFFRLATVHFDCSGIAGETFQCRPS